MLQHYKTISCVLIFKKKQKTHQIHCERSQTKNYTFIYLVKMD